MRAAFAMLALVGGTSMILSAAFAQSPMTAPPATTGASSPLPPGPGRDTTIRVCSGCHDPAIVAQQRLSRDGWIELVNTMAARGAKATDAQLDEITTYLATSFPETSAKP